MSLPKQNFDSVILKQTKNTFATKNKSKFFGAAVTLG